jgi:hypothetical protein
MSPEAGFILVSEIIPRLRSSIPGSVRLLGSDDVEELVQDGTAIAAQFLHSAEERGKSVTPGNVAHYALKYLKSGRRSTGFWKSDVLHPAAQMSGRSRVHSIEEPLTFTELGDEPVTLGEALASHNDDPGVEAARRMDWEEFQEKLDAVAKAILNAMVAGQELTALVGRLGKSRSALQGHKNRLAGLIKEEFGPDILALAEERAAWRTNLDSARKRQNCRWERQAA